MTISLSAQEPQILFENDQVAIVFKPANFLSVRSRFHEKNPQRNIIDHFGAPAYLPLHRLDFEVAGLMLLAKNKAAQSQISAYFAKRTIHKTYWALSIEADLSLFEKLPFGLQKVEVRSGEKVLWTSKILRGKKRSYSSPHGDLAQSEALYLGEEKLSSYTLHKWQVSPLTGRSHQLRFELARHGQPVVGDELYFAPICPTYSNGIALVAVQVNFADCEGYKDLNLPEEFSLGIDWKAMLAQVVLPAAIPIAEMV